MFAFAACLCLAASSPKISTEPYRWLNVPIVAGGFISGVTFHPAQRDLAYLRTDIGGAYRWDANGRKWIPLQDWLTQSDWNLYGIESLGLDLRDPSRLYLACGTYTNDWGGNGAILRSSDQGRTFKRTNVPFKMGGNEDGRSMGERLAVDPFDGRHLVMATRHDGLWKSNDGAATWSAAPTPPFPQNGIGLGPVVFDPNVRGSLYLGVSMPVRSLYHSADSGATWQPMIGVPRGLFPHQMKFGAHGRLYVTFADKAGPNGMSEGAVLRLDTSTGAWTDITPVHPHQDGEGGFGYAGLSVVPGSPDVVMISTMDRWSPSDDLFRSVDQGRTWSAFQSKSVRDVSRAPYMTWGGGQAKFGWWIGALAIDPFRPSHVWYGTGANLFGTVDADVARLGKPTHWTIQGEGIEETAVIDLLSPQTGSHLIDGLGDIGGFTHVNFDRPAPGMTRNPMFGNTDSLDEAGRLPGFVVRVGRADARQRRGAWSADGGITWSPFATEPAASRGSGTVAVGADGQTIAWNPSGAPLSVSSDRGSTWNLVEGLPASGRVVADRVDPARFTFLASDGSVWKSSNRGAGFERSPFHFSTRIEQAKYMPGLAGELWVPAEDGLYRSGDSGTSFFRIHDVERAHGVGFGKAAPGRNFPAVYLVGRVNSVDGVFRSDDAGVTWTKISDAAHEYGTCKQVTGDPRLYSRVYLGTNGRGVLYADPAK